tara:strand:+ start:333 stop:2294 length:1962 start_codon:yes stop_codon:yes gene_type:complete
MANGYGYNVSSSSARQSRTNAQGQTAPPGFHYMPDGTLMSDAEHNRLYGSSDKVISSFDLDFSDLPSISSFRNFSIQGDKGAQFTLEIKDKDTGKYYNFITNTFQTEQTKLEEEIKGNTYRGRIKFPAVTGSDDQYDIFLYAVPGTRHADYNEVRFRDGSIDINSSTGSNSLMVQKVIYQYATVTLTLKGYSPGGTVAGTMGQADIDITRADSRTKTPFSFTTTAGATAAYRILRQPTVADIISFVEPTVGAAPEILPGENEYPTARAAFTGDDVNGAVTSGTTVDTDAADISTNIAIGDKITTPVTTDTVNGAVTSGVNVVMDSAVATKMAVGDRVTAPGVIAALDAKVVTVAVVGVGGDANTFALSEAVAISDGITLTFSSQVNRSLTTVSSFPVDESAFVISQEIQFRDNAPLTFTPRANYQWPVDNMEGISEGMIAVSGSLHPAGTKISKYEDITTLFENTTKEKIIIKNSAPAKSTKGVKPTVVKGKVTVQQGNIVFNKQQPFSIATQTLKIGGYGLDKVFEIHGYRLLFTDLAITLTAPTTTTTEATTSHATIAVADKEGVINNVSRVGGIGINPALQNPLITSGGGQDGPGDWVMDAVQTLENGITLTIENTGRIATISGNVEVVKAGVDDAIVRFDVNKLLSTSA